MPENNHNATPEISAMMSDPMCHQLNVLNREAFGNEAEKLALALGRPLAEIKSLLTGATPVDDDLAMKIHGVAAERGVTLS